MYIIKEKLLKENKYPSDYVEENILLKPLYMIGIIKGKEYRLNIEPFMSKGSIKIEILENKGEYLESVFSDKYIPKYSSGMPWQVLTKACIEVWNIHLKGNTKPLEDRFTLESIVNELYYNFKFKIMYIIKESFKKLGTIEWDSPYMNTTVHYEGIDFSNGKFHIRIYGKSGKKSLSLLLDDKEIFSTKSYLKILPKQAIELIDKDLIPIIDKCDSYNELEKLMKSDKDFSTQVYKVCKDLLYKIG